MQPNKVSGVLVSTRIRSCESKRRFADEFAARVMGAELPTTGYVYKCELCRGWHITSRRISKDARSDFYMEESK